MQDAVQGGMGGSTVVLRYRFLRSAGAGQYVERKGRCGLIVWEPSQKMECQREKGNQAIIYFGSLIRMWEV